MRLIDADALIKSIEGDRDCSDMPSQWIDGVNYAIDLIKLYAPTIDAVSVVRCRKCTWYAEDGCFFSTVEVKGDDYCSYGERSKE